MKAAAAALVLLAATLPAQAACPDMATIARFAAALLDRTTPVPFGPLTMPQARCAQDRLVATLAQPWGDVAGRAVMASPDGALSGALFHGTLRAESGSVIEARYGARPVLAPAILLRIARDGIEHAGDDLAAIAGFVDEAAPLLVLLDLAGIPQDADAPARMAGNLGIRLGVRGTSVPLAPQDALDLQRAFAVLDLDGSPGRRATSFRAPTLGGDPVDLVGRLARDMAAERRPLRAGDLVAVIGPSQSQAPRAGENWRLWIPRLGGVVVNFR